LREEQDSARRHTRRVAEQAATQRVFMSGVCFDAGRDHSRRWPLASARNRLPLGSVLWICPLIQEFDSMTEKIIKVPGPDHPITVEPAQARVVVTVAGRVIADTRNALVLREASYPPVYYIPRNDVEMTLLERTDHTTYCPYKGDCAYYSIPIGGERTVNAVWTYESPYAPVKEIAQHLAFYPNRVDSIEVQPAG
jgi:uncharacterized protein (DUF427 family)